MVTIRPPHCALIRTQSDGVCFEHGAQNKHHRLTFNATHSVYWRCHCVVAVMLAIVLRAPRHSAFLLGRCGITVRMLHWCDRGLTLLEKLKLCCTSNEISFLIKSSCTYSVIKLLLLPFFSIIQKDKAGLDKEELKLNTFTYHTEEEKENPLMKLETPGNSLFA